MVAGAQSKIRIMFGSCNKVAMDQPFWPIIADYQPDVWIWGGDNIYSDNRRKISWQTLPSDLVNSLKSGMHMLDFFFVPASEQQV